MEQLIHDQHDTETASMDASTLIGYARVSTAEQSLEIQINALKKAGYHQIFTDVASGAKADHPGLDKTLEHLCDGNTLAVQKVDHLGHSLVHSVQTVDALRERGVGFRSLTDAGIDTTTCNGKLLFNLFAILAEFERGLISERAKTSLTMARARSRNGGRRTTAAPEKLAKARRLMDKKRLTVKGATAVFDVGHSTSYRALNTECDTPTKDSG